THERFQHLSLLHPRDTLVQLLMGSGLGLLALLPTVLVRLGFSLQQSRYIYALLPAALVPAVLALFSGGDLPRLSSPASPFLALVLALYVVRLASATQIVLLTAAMSLILENWHPFDVVARAPWSYVLY